MKKILCLLMCTLMVTTLFIGCAKNEVTSTESESSDSSDKSEDNQKLADELYIGVYCLGNLEYFYDHKIGLKAAGELMGVKTKYVGPPDYDIAAMVAAFEQAIAEKPAGIITFGAEGGLLPVINKAIDAGIPVVTVDGDISKSKRVSFVGTGNYGAGYLGGTKLGEAIGGQGKVAIVTPVDVELHQERTRGYKDALAELYPDVEVVQVADSKSDPVHVVQVTAALLQKYPDLTGIACTDASGGGGASTAVEEAGLVGKVKLIVMDRDRQVLDKIMNGVITGSIVQKSALMPLFALQIIYNMKHANIAITTDDKAANFLPVPASIDTGVTFVDKSNAEYFMRD